ncbi:hypothetical protein KAFR_0D03910 [Kazachstania africana CBS 2517]|uniref:SEC14 homolog 3 n=1 Tax=Kazachstania africana (strain ATCC 22294 / BCRC 22015 / CBS 2517 / CECT 1963 / NBRC 1671 / NRRL Y-8276) TaxID=1071382 RepID=H2AUI9_KAZAF|nr:hypothetical protein KAFR_0D03910 [Kazachstania africana CBS 2517]CCF58039.1 hypothetical protein KAFR_0D03910 [Kazachstania africana CBS 2517]
MGLFSKKAELNTPNTNKDQLIKIDQVFPLTNRSHPPKRLRKLTEEQFSKYNEVLSHFKDESLTLPISTDPSSDKLPLNSWEMFWLSRECIYRYLKAQKWNVANAIKALTNTLTWRRESGLVKGINKQLDPNEIGIENETGKEVILGYDYSDRPVFYMRNGRQNTESSFRQVQHLIFMAERTVMLCPQGVDSMSVLVDFKKYKGPGIISDKAPPVSIAKACLGAFENHYPERLGRMLFTNIPWFIWAFIKLMYPFLDPDTKEKVVFDEPFEKYVDPKQLDSLYNGLVDFQYSHKLYWPDFVEKTEALYQKQYERFVKFGGVIGLSEFDFKGDHDEMIYPVDCDMTKI